MSAPPPAPGSAALLWAGTDCAVALAPAKVNLFLELRARRPDGFHALETLLLPVTLADTLEVRKTPGPGVTIECAAPGVPTDGTNLIAKAAAALARLVGRELGAAVRLTKRIPHAAGLGGGSSDAAAMLLALNALYRLDCSPEALAAVAAGVGSDVPAFLTGPAAWCTGRGEVIAPAPVGKPIDLVIVKPEVGLATAAVYANCAVPAAPNDGRAAREALASGVGRRVAETLFNRLAGPAEALLPELAALRAALVHAGALAAAVSGSGSAVFAVCADAPSARRVAAGVRGSGSVFVTRALSARGVGSNGVAS